MRIGRSWGLGRKDSLARNIDKMRRRCRSKLSRDEMKIIPDTFILPADLSMVQMRFSQYDLPGQKSELWIFKPAASSCGRGTVKPRVLH